MTKISAFDNHQIYNNHSMLSNSIEIYYLIFNEGYYILRSDAFYE